MECCEHRTRERTESERKNLTNRLKRIEGQVRGLVKMIDDNAYCNDILIQASAVRSAIDAFAKELLSSHIKGCVVKDIKEGNDRTVEELISTVSAWIGK